MSIIYRCLAFSFFGILEFGRMEVAICVMGPRHAKFDVELFCI